jgi:Protein phosphatase 2C
MSRSEEDLKQIVAVIYYRLGIIKEKPDQLDQIWADLMRSNDYDQQARKISQDLAKKFERAFACMLGLHDSKTGEHKDNLVKLWRSSFDIILAKKNYLTREEEEDIKRIISEVVNDVFKQKSPELFPVVNNRQSGLDDTDKILEQIRVENTNQSANKSNNFSVETPSINQEISPPTIIVVNNELTEKYKSQSIYPDSQKLLPAPIPPLQIQPQPQRDMAPVADNLEQQVKSTPLDNNIYSPSNPENQQPSPQEVNLNTGIKWNYLPVPEGLDKHDEFYCKESKSTDGLKLIGARVRGKGHKHQGTNCDDWFDFSVSGNWTIIAVSDGAGSKNFSRVGAKASCEAAVKYLSQKLKNFIIQERDTKKYFSADLNRDKNWIFPGKDIESVQNFLHEAVQFAYNAVAQAATERSKQTEYYKILNKDLEVSDFSATLLLAVHTIVKAGGTNYNLVLTSQVGDGILAAVSCEGSLELLGKPDSGPYSGQTEFLTSKNKRQKENLLQKTFVFAGHLKALMVMTDGVADDYFPNDPNMLELYGDLVLNHVIQITKPNETDITQHLMKTQLGSIGGVREAKDKFQSKIVRVIDPTQKNEPSVARIYSVADYAKELGKSVHEVVASSALLAGGILNEQMCNECYKMQPEERLQLWLDSYYKKGSFDDRTLVILYREEG